MGRRADFLQLVQTALSQPAHSSNAVTTAIRRNSPMHVMATAQLIPEEALPPEVYKGALDFITWMAGEPMPIWLMEYEENKRSADAAREKLITIAVNPDADADGWWMLAEQSTDLLPKACLAIVCDRVDSIRVSPRDAEAFIDWGASIPNWEAEPFTIRDQKGVDFKPPPRKRT